MKYCEDCGGDGKVDILVGSYWDTRLGQFYPNYKLVVCPTCDGTGETDRVEDDASNEKD